MLRKIYNSIMRRKYNPLSNIPNVATGHLIMQVLAWMWCVVFSMWVGSIYIFGVTAIAHAIIIAGIFITAVTFYTAKETPSVFNTIANGTVSPEINNSVLNRGNLQNLKIHIFRAASLRRRLYLDTHPSLQKEGGKQKVKYRLATT